MPKTTPSFELLKYMVSYEPQLGIFRWRHAWSSSRFKHGAGDVILGSKSNGYLYLRFKGYQVLGHRAAWALMTGGWPSNQIDHVNMDRSDNRWCNLREATNSQNMMNRPAQSNNKSTGVKGVTSIIRTMAGGELKHYGYMANITKDKKTYYLGLYKTIVEAKAAYDAEAEKLHREFSRT